jgi:hypothetical protein
MFRSKADEINDSTLEPPGLYGNDFEDIDTDRDIHSSTDSSTSSSVSTSISPPRPKQQKQNEAASSSSSFSSADFHSSSSESSPVNSPQHKLFDIDSKAQGNFEVSNRKFSKNQAEDKETGSAKLRRILYGSSSSSLSEEYIILSSSSSRSSGSTALKYEKENDESDYKSRNKDRKDSFVRVEEEDYSNNENETFEGNNADRSNSSSDIQSKPSRSRPETHQRNHVSTHNDDVLGISTTSPNFSLDSQSHSRTKSKSELSTSTNSRSTSSQANKSQGSTSKSSRIISNPSSKVSNPSSKVAEICDSSEGFMDSNIGSNVENNEIGWKPPALTTFSLSNYDKSTKDYRKKKQPKARQSTFVSKQGSKPTPIDFISVKRKMKNAKNKIPPPISQIVISLPPDDDSTLGTEGTYLERFPKKKKNRNKLHSKANRVGSTLIVSTTAEMVNANESQADRNSGDIAAPNKPFEFETQLRGTLENDVSEELKASPHQRPGFGDLESNENNVASGVHSGTRGNSDSHLQRSADPPGDSFLFSYDPQNLPPLFESPDSTYVESRNYTDKDSTRPELTTNVWYSLARGPETQQHLSSSMPVTTWVPQSLQSRGGEIELDPTRIFITSLMTNKRTMPSTQLLSNNRQVWQGLAEPRPQSQIAVGYDRSEATGGSASECSTSRSHNIRTTDVSESTSKNASEPRDMLRSESSSSQSHGNNAFDNSASSSNRRGGISRSRNRPNLPRRQSLVMPDVSFNSDTTDSSHDMEQAMTAPQSIQNALDNSASSKNRHREISTSRNRPNRPRRQSLVMPDVSFNSVTSSQTSPSLMPPPASEESFSTQVDLPKSSERSRKTMILLLWFFVVLIVASAIVVVVLWQIGILFNNQDDDSQYTSIALPTPMPQSPVMPSTKAPSVAPPDVENEINLSDLIVEAYPQSQPALENPNSPQAKALKWLESSTNSGISKAQSFLQRYTLATVYYSTKGDDWIDNTGWLSEENECYWMSKAQLICDDLGKFVKLDLQENNLVGTLPDELGILSDTLRSINIRKNNLSGQLPSRTISDLTNLEVLDLSSNDFSGVLHPELFDATSLTRLSLFENNFSSSIPTEVGQLTKLDVLDLGSNKLTSTIPTTIEKLTKLAGLSLFNNMLTGTVPAELSGIQSLEMLYIDSNELEAPLPTEVCGLHIREFWGDCEEIQCTCCTTCCINNFGCFVV